MMEQAVRLVSGVDHSPQVLIVDDSRSDLFLLQNILESHGYQVHCLVDSTQTLEQSRVLLPDVILLDVQMPVMDGFEVCSQLKEDPGLCEIPVLFLTVMDDVKAKVRAFELGGCDYLVKPAAPAELLARVSTQIRLRQVQLDLASKNHLLSVKIQDLEKSHAALRESEFRIEAVLDNAAVCIAVLGSDGTYQMVNGLCAAMLGYEIEAFSTLHCWDVLHPDFADSTRETMKQLLHGKLDKAYGTKRFRRKDGSVFWGGQWLSRRQDSDGVCTGFICILSDLTEQKKAEDDLRLAHTVFETLREGVMVNDGENRIVTVNPAFSTITGYSLDEVIGRDPDMLQSGQHDHGFYRDIRQTLLQENRWEGEIWSRRRNGENYPQWLSLSLIRREDNSIANYVGVFSDITERKNAENILRRQALYDPLTQLPNRSMFDERLNAVFSRARRHEEAVALLYFDLDNFKNINDTMGHMAGDQVLKKIAEHLRQCLRPEDMVARLGGDEFAAILTDFTDIQSVLSVVERILSSVTNVCPADTPCALSLSIGIALFPEHGTDAETVLRCADDAMYTAKRLGRGRYHLADDAVAQH